jgi:hypothetical protein
VVNLRDPLRLPTQLEPKWLSIHVLASTSAALPTEGWPETVGGYTSRRWRGGVAILAEDGDGDGDGDRAQVQPAL